ncbi:histidine phosphatase family protein [Halomonas denitrificans]|uniref:histidine phosphatase family protein n=1 Tax=Halomonas denitrificans TaxID=370769 RepID=UPI001CD38F84|nr:histidine phosphatase family protein [Halomonas denitrificans]MCA0974364.1 histidine phosphatase family protein [Halomonas denitrificans]
MADATTVALPHCHNHYLVMRHGHSQANARGLIVSSPTHGCEGYGLSAKGEEQLQHRLDSWHLATPTHIVHSDFLRTTQTAEHVGAYFSLTPTPDQRLRERFFGDLDQGPDSAYASIWSHDAENPHHHLQGCESVADVVQRMFALIIDLEARLHHQTILLVSHGDPLHILLAAASGQPLSAHRDQPPLAPADIRPLIVGADAAGTASS